MSDELARMDATAQAELVSSGEAKPAELIDAAIERAEQVNPEINAIIHDLSSQAREQATGALPDGPFKGVPFLLKDLGAAFAGQPLHLGMKLLKETGFNSPVDTTLAERFRTAGLVTIGKTNTPELGIVATTEPAAYGATKNPWDTTRTPGGSSGGSGAAVAAGIVPMAHANDGGGSIRIPASNCGLVGLKPTRQRISEGPLVGDVMSGVTVELCVSRSVRDTARLLEAVHGPAPGDPYVAPPPIRPYTDELEDESGGLRIGVLDEALIEGVEVAAPCREAVASAAKLCESLGHSVDGGSIADVLPTGEGGPDLEETFLTRWAAGQAATLTQLGLLVGRPVTADDVERLTWDMAQIGHERDGARYLLDVGLHQMLSRMVAGWFESGYDLLLTPTMAEVAPKLGEIDTSKPDLAAYQRCLPSGAFTALFNLTGQPGINVPLHWTEEGVPVGAQFVAPFGREDLLIRIAAQLEKAAPWAERTPPVFAAAGYPHRLASRLSGVLTAMATPFDASGDVDYAAAAKLAVHLLENGSDGLVVAGTTGEAATLSDEEQIDLLRAVRAEVGQEALLVCGSGTNDTRHSIALTKAADEAGADAMLVVTPYYNKPNPAGIRAHVDAVAGATAKPIVIYNIPSRTVVNMPPELLAELARIANVVAVKQANDAELQAIAGLDVLAGNDGVFLRALEIGGTGGITVASHLVGPQMAAVRDRFEAGDLDGAREIDASLQPIYDALGVTTNPMPLKAALQMLGICSERMRLPMVPLDEGQREVVRRALEAVGLEVVA